MKKVILFDTSYGTRNMGDYIINESVMKEMRFLFDDSFLIRFGTHNPLLHQFQMALPGSVKRTCQEARLKFLGGTNLLKQNLLHPNSGWNIDILTSLLYRGSVSIGCGLAGTDKGRINSYTRKVYERALSKDFVHSVRDEASKVFLERMGFEAYNTGCPTLWGFNDELNASIPREKAESVVFTLTDYMPDMENDQRLISILNESYQKVYFWIQGSRDYDYLQQFSGIDNIVLIKPSLDAYREVLKSGGVDYVGTRLHAGIFAMQHGVRSVILAVDHRARDMNESHSLNVVEREDLSSLSASIEGSITTRVTFDRDLVESWKSQFKLS